MTAVRSAAASKPSGDIDRRFSGIRYAGAGTQDNSVWATAGSRLQKMDDAGREEQDDRYKVLTGDEDAEVSEDRSEAEKIYEAVISGKRNPIEELRTPSKVPYGHLAKDGIIEYNGVIFTCDEKTNSICLGDMTDPKKVLNIPLSGGGHLKVNRDSIGQLSKAAGMFSPEDLNLIMRAIAQDTKIQSMEKEIDDAEASVGNQLKNDSESGDASEPEEV